MVWLKRSLGSKKAANGDYSASSTRDGDSDGHVSDIDPSSSAASSVHQSSDEEDEDESPTLVTVDRKSAKFHKVSSQRPSSSPPPIAMPNNAKDGIVHLLRQEFQHGGNLFSLSPDDYLKERRRKRLVSKKGVVQIARTKVESRRRRYLSDFFNTMLDIKWRYVLLIFSASFFMSWLGFAVLWYLIMLFRGDFEPEHLPDHQAESNYQPCVLAIHNFASVFLFSVETQHTIGYGSRQTTERCPEAIFMQSLQSVVGVMIQACMVGTIFAKLARPQKRTQTLMFSRNAVVCSRDGVLCLLFRVANLRPSHLIETHVRALLISKKVTVEGEIIPYHQTELKVGVDMEGDEDTMLFIWPTTVVHRIDNESPFFHMSAKDFMKKHYEIIVVLEGIVEPTGMSIQARSSYMGDEILWGYRFVNVLNYDSDCYRIDYSSFNSVYKVDTPTCSAKHLLEECQPHQIKTADKPPTTAEVLDSPTTTTTTTTTISNHVGSPLMLQQVKFMDSPQLQTANLRKKT